MNIILAPLVWLIGMALLVTGYIIGVLATQNEPDKPKPDEPVPRICETCKHADKKEIDCRSDNCLRCLCGCIPDGWERDQDA